MSKRPSDYTVQDGCHNCQHSFRDSNPDGTQLLCTLHAGDRPLHPADVDFRQLDQTVDVWEAWADGREVQPAGTCSNWERKRA